MPVHWAKHEPEREPELLGPRPLRPMRVAASPVVPTAAAAAAAALVAATKESRIEGLHALEACLQGLARDIP